MITKSNLENLLVGLDFHKDLMRDLWLKDFALDSKIYTLEVDCVNEKFLYEKAGITVTGSTTANFSQNENFVVFECVCRLLKKGYKPKDIELEPTWKLGHTDKSGRADIWVRTVDKSGKHSLLIIECKTAGKEFNDAWRDTLEDGAQLFSYCQQELGTKFLCLYTSDIVDGVIKSEYRIINVQDNEDYLKTLKKPKKYSEAKNNKSLFAVWRDTYKLEYATLGLFEKDIAPYKPGKNKYSVDDLREIDHLSMQKKYHEFATILRQHNVSGHENAFDKLVNLFLAKVVDEKLNPTDLRFYWKGIAYDDDFSLQDRLQFLYMIGMREFLSETVTYIDEATVKKAFRRFEKDPDATKDAILDYFRQLKFYSNNDFSFIDVHNERLFKENAAILLKIVQMLEDIKLKTEKPNQFLGDLFEGFLDKGVKQSEGQFFTPLPIVRFIVSSLPLQEIVREAREPPRVIDYACGAGHFLNEYAQQVKHIVKKLYGGDEKEEHSHYSSIVGIEKEYRLSKVAKVAAFMYGEDDIQIAYADALAKNDKAPEASFDILIANPPYSVKGFLETLSEEDRARYELMSDDLNLAKVNSIETFFVERAVQLLKPTGIAAIILPSSILSNGGGVYVKCREIILKNFDVIAIAEFGSGTFGKTGTNTITAFLRKKDAPPNFANHWRNRVDAWFSAKHGGDEVFGDAAALERYCAHRKFDLEEYKEFLGGTLPAATTLWGSDVFKTYRATFAKIKKPKLTEAEFIRNNERERLYYFLLADANPVPVLVIKMPTETKAAKTFLGYEWSAAKGNEGIKYIGAASVLGDEEDEALLRNKGIEAIKTPLFDNSNLFATDKLNAQVRLNFSGALVKIPGPLQPFAKCIDLTDMLDFDDGIFDKKFRTNATSVVEIKSKYPMVKLGEITETIGGLWTGKKPPFKTVSVIRNTNFTMHGALDLSNVAQIEVEERAYQKRCLLEGDIIVEKSGGSETQAVGRVVYFGKIVGDYSFSNFTIRLRATSLKINKKFLCLVLHGYWLMGQTFPIQHGASGLKNLDVSKYLTLKIPMPPLDIQQQVVAECEKVDEEYNTSRMTIKQYREKIAEVFGKLDVVNWGGGGIS